VRFVRLVSFAIIVSVAGLSSSFALCVSTCTDAAPGAAASHACHEHTVGVSMTAGDGSCPHGPVFVAQGDITRDDRAPLAIAEPFVTVSTIVLPVSAVRGRTAAYPPARPVSSPPVLRI
jgi:hypothetical protein